MLSSRYLLLHPLQLFSLDLRHFTPQSHRVITFGDVSALDTDAIKIPSNHEHKSLNTLSRSHVIAPISSENKSFPPWFFLWGIPTSNSFATHFTSQNVLKPRRQASGDRHHWHGCCRRLFLERTVVSLKSSSCFSRIPR